MSTGLQAFGALGKRLALRKAIPFALLLCVLCFSGCHHELAVDTSPLDSAGMNYDSIRQLKAADVTTAEVAEVSKARQGGLPDAACVAIFQIYRARKQPFDAGSSAAALLRSGMAPDTIVGLATLNQLGVESGELEAMRLAGISDDIVLEVARHHAQGKAVLAGVSLARMRNTGMRNTTLLELARRGVPDSQSTEIVALRRHGLNDAEILRHFSGS
jgi:hypothetical protein